MVQASPIGHEIEFSDWEEQMKAVKSKQGIAGMFAKMTEARRATPIPSGGVTLQTTSSATVAIKPEPKIKEEAAIELEEIEDKSSRPIPKEIVALPSKKRKNSPGDVMTRPSKRVKTKESSGKEKPTAMSILPFFKK